MSCPTIHRWVGPKSYKVQIPRPHLPCADHKFKGADVEDSIAEHAHSKN